MTTLTEPFRANETHADEVDDSQLLVPIAAPSSPEDAKTFDFGPSDRDPNDTGPEFVRVLVDGRGMLRFDYRGYAYGLQTNNKNTRNWRCTLNRTCRARATSKRSKCDDQLRIRGRHNHSPANKHTEGRCIERFRVCAIEG